MIYWAIVGVYSAYEYNIRLNERKVRNAELERLVTESQLQTLRSQINPHFLFNTLNAISAYVEGNPRMARRMLEQLAGLLRTAFDFDKLQEIPLDRDLAFLKRYLALQQVRYDERMEVLLTAAPDTLDALVPAFILQPLIENAINHGIAKQSEKGLIEVSAWREDGRLRLRVRDDGPGLPPSWDVATSVGVGIGNTRERLRFLYGAAGHSFQISNREDRSGVEVNLILPLRLPEQRAADPLVDESYQHSRR
jgi:LytS/YehU family sensor histidine kinase